MCLFRYSNKNETSKAYKAGLTHFECGSCPECLQKKSRMWALRCSAQAKVDVGMMVTLTYDTYKYDKQGNIIGENLNADMKLSKRDVQNFFKRLRERYPDNAIKYLCTAERGKRTNRPHYHAIIFGLVFDDLMLYKKSKRGNIIYRSKTLEKIWQGGRSKQKGGICTIDAVNLSPRIARYCTKYCAKDAGVDDTFMLFSHGIGDAQLLKDFNGKSYWIDGREYSIPRKIWQLYIEKKYKIKGYSKYVNSPADFYNTTESVFYNKLSYIAQVKIDKNRSDNIKRALRSKNRRESYTFYRDNDVLYKRYIKYWKRKNEIYEKYRPDVQSRILSLPNNKYWSYKNKAIEVYRNKKMCEPYIPPRSNSKAMYNYWIRERSVICRKVPCHYKANDSFKVYPYLISTKNGFKWVFLKEEELRFNPFKKYY